MKFSFSKFFYHNLITIGVHLGEINKFKINKSETAFVDFNQFLCLDLKQSYKELNKTLLLAEYIGSIQGKMLIVSGGHRVVNPSISTTLFSKSPIAISASSVEFAGLIANDIRPRFGIPSLAFVANSDHYGFTIYECCKYLIPLISLVDVQMSIPLCLKLLTYKILSNDDAEGISVFFMMLFKHACLRGAINKKLSFLKKKNNFSFYYLK